jgi:uncharacterized membrane protein
MCNTMRNNSHKRVIVKTLLYRAIAILLTLIVSYIVTGSTFQSIKLALMVEFIQGLIYYLYELIWNHITWGVL